MRSANGADTAEAVISRLIDVHQHVIPDVYRAALARIGVIGSGENPFPSWSVTRALALMDRHSIAAVMASIASPGAYFGDLDFTRTLVRDCNEALAQLVDRYGARFGAMGFVPLPDVAAAAREVEYALDVLNLDGINLLTHTGDRYLGHVEEEELYAELDRRSAVVFVHPVRPPIRGLPRATFPSGYTELVFDTTRAIANMLFNGTFVKFPRIRFIMPHAGGVIPFLLYRLKDLGSERGASEYLAGGVAPQLRTLYYDIAQSASSAALRSLLEVADPARILFGTDYPLARSGENVIPETIAAFSAIELAADLRRKIEIENARALFPRFAKVT